MGRGGTRPGAGRKTKNEGENRVSINCRVRPSTRETIIHMAKDAGISMGEMIDRLAESKK